MKGGARIWPRLALCAALAFCIGLPAAALADPAPQAPATPASRQDYINDDADLVVGRHNPCGEGDAPLAPVVTYDYSAARINDYYANNQVRAQGTDSGHRLLVRGVIGDCGGLLLSHLASRTPFPGGAESFDSIGFVAMAQAENFDFYAGLGVTFYSGLANDQTLDVLFHIRRHVLYNLSIEANVAMPLSQFFSSNQDPHVGHDQMELALRLDWKNVALRYGYRTYQINAIIRDGAFAGLTLKF